MTTLTIADLHASVDGKQILRGIDLSVTSGQVHAVMGPNGAGKSTLSAIVMGKPGYEVTRGSVHLDDTDVLSLPTWQRAQLGLHLVMQYPTEVPGVAVLDAMTEAFSARGRDSSGVAEMLRAEAERINFPEPLLLRSLNVDLSGGEKKRNETLQLAVLKPKIAILDELDSGLDIDALRDCARRVEDATNEDNLGVLVITHYSRLLKELGPTSCTCSSRVASSQQVVLNSWMCSTDGYAAFESDADADVVPGAGTRPSSLDDLFAMPPGRSSN